MSADEISDEELDAQYRAMIDSFIDQANQLAETSSPENVGMALLFAASRFNAFVVSQHAESIRDYEKDLDKARDFFQNQYRQMLEENLQDYKNIYLKYQQFVKN